ncbi:MAG: 3-ketoacyl-ACP reductase [Lentisphaeria bacterium]
MQKLNILITGGTRGIGAGIVRCLAAAGHHVGFCGRSENPDYTVAAAGIRDEFSVNCAYYPCDIACTAAREQLLRNFIGNFGSLDVLVNNAGVAPEVRSDLLDMSEESFQRVLAINLCGPFFLTQAAARQMLAHEANYFRCIINIGSISADYASINRGEYCLSKAAISMSTKLWAVRLAEAGIAVYELRPGVIQSDMTSKVRAKYDKMIAEGLTLQRRWGQPEDVGKAVLMLVNASLPYSTGQVINIDGGLSIERL